MDNQAHFSAVKVEVSCISKSHDSKVLVISNESSARDVLKMALHKCKNRKVSPEDILLIAEADQQMQSSSGIELLHFEDDDKPLFTYLRYPKGAVRFYIKPKNKDKFQSFKDSSSPKDEKKQTEPKPSLAGHQFTVDRLRKSLERLRRRSISDADSSPAPSSGNTTPSTAASFTPSFTPFTQSSRSKSFSEYRGVANVSDRGVANFGDRGVANFSDRGVTNVNESANMNGSTMNSIMKPREDCMIVYDNPVPVRPKPTMGTYVPKSDAMSAYVPKGSDGPGAYALRRDVNEPRIRSKHYEQQLAKQGVLMNGIESSNAKSGNFRNLEDSGIDMNTPPFLTKQYGNSTPNGNQSSSSAFTVVGNRTLTSSCSPYSTVSADPYDGVRRTNSFSIPNDSKHPSGKENTDLTRTQSLQSLNGMKVKRRRSLPQVEITKETLEEKKNSLSQRLAKKIGKYRKEGNTAILPSTFSPQTLELFKELQQAKGKLDIDFDDCMSVSSLEVATILDGKPTHPTDEDVEEYLSMVEPAYGGKPKSSTEKPKTTPKDNGVSHIPKPKLEPKHFANNALSVDKIQKHFKQKQKVKHSHSMGDFEQRRPKPADHHIKQSDNSNIQRSPSHRSNNQTSQSDNRSKRHSFSHKEQYEENNFNRSPETRNSKRNRESKRQQDVHLQNGVGSPKINGHRISGAYSENIDPRVRNQPIKAHQHSNEPITTHQHSNDPIKSQNSKLQADDIKIDLTLPPDDAQTYKPLSLFTILKTHFLVMVYLEKGEYFKSYGIMVCKSTLDNKVLTGYDDGCQSVITISKIIEGGPADLEGTLQPGDIIVEINGHHVLQSSDKAVRALLDARSSLELVVARLQEGMGYESPPISSV